MPKRVKCFMREVSVIDEVDHDSVGMFLDFDGLEDPEQAVEWIKARKKLGSQVTIWDVLAVMLFIGAANKVKKEV